jgi:hypothetical protein
MNIVIEFLVMLALLNYLNIHGFWKAMAFLLFLVGWWSTAILGAMITAAANQFVRKHNKKKFEVCNDED